VAIAHKSFLKKIQIFGTNTLALWGGNSDAAINVYANGLGYLPNICILALGAQWILSIRWPLLVSEISFRDVLSLVQVSPQLARKQICRSASVQLKRDDDNTGGHPPNRAAGVRTQCSDDFLWFAICTGSVIALYCGILDSEWSRFFFGRGIELRREESYYWPFQLNPSGLVFSSNGHFVCGR